MFVHRYATTRDSDTGIPESKIAEMLDLVLDAYPMHGARTNGTVGSGRLVKNAT